MQSKPPGSQIRSTVFIYLLFAMSAFCLDTMLFAQTSPGADPSLPTDNPGEENDALLDQVDADSGLHEWHRYVRG